MRKALRSGIYKFEILRSNESILTFRDVATTTAFFNRFKNDPSQMSILTDIVRAHTRSEKPLHADEVIRQCITLVTSGKITIIRSNEFMPGTGESASTQPQPPGSPPGPGPAKKSWIEIKLIDVEGKPVAGEKYRIKLPDGSVNEAKLDAFGHAEYYGINPGNCEVSFLDRDAIEWGPG